MLLRSIAFVLVVGLAVIGCASTGTVPRPSPFPGATQPASAPPSRPSASGVADAPVPSGYPKPLPPTVKSFSTTSFITAAKQLLGVHYKMGGETPQTGFDCSGYVQYVYRLFRIQIPRSVYDQYKAGKKASSDAIKAGDLLFFKTSGNTVSHVALAIGPDEFIHAPSENGVVRIEKLSSPYWHARFIGARRIL